MSKPYEEWEYSVCVGGGVVPSLPWLMGTQVSRGVDAHPALISYRDQKLSLGPSQGVTKTGNLCEGEKKKKHIGPTERSELTLADSFGRVKGIDLSVAIRQISELSIWRGKNASPGRGLPF